MEELAAFGALCLIALIVYLWLTSTEAKDRKDQDNIDLAKYLEMPWAKIYPVDSYEGKKELRKILSDSDIRKKAEERRNKYQEEKRKEEDKTRKDKIIKRTFSYKYEDALYEIFAPYAIKREYEYNGQIWSYPFYKRLENDFVISELSRILSLSQEEAKKLFDQLEKNDLIDIDSKLIQDGTLGGKLIKADRCELGSLLKYDWNIISQEDMNLSKWIEQHPNRETKESMDKRRGVKKETIAFKDYVRREGGFSIKYDKPYINIEVNNGKILHLSESQIGKPLANYQYRLEDFIESIENKLVVDIDDEEHTLRVVQ